MLDRSMIGWPGVLAALGPDAPSQRTLERMVIRGEFPKPLKVSPRRVLFNAQEIEAWIKARSAQREGVKA